MRNKTNSLLTDLYELTMAASYYQYKPDTMATFDLFIRKMPPQRSYFIAAGLESALRYLERVRFDKEELKYLKGLKLFPQEFIEYLTKFRFRGTVWALPEGTVFFPEEPIIRITAPIIEAQIIESFLLNIINLQVTMATKAARVVTASRGRAVYDFSLRRTQGREAAMQVARCSYMAGCRGTSNVLAGKVFDIPVAGTMAHSFVMSFESELSSFRAFARTFPQKAILLIDTYKEMQGLRNAITVAKEMEQTGVKLRGIRLDSGDFVSSSKKMRRILDNKGLSYVGIFASGNLDEYKIKTLLDRGARIDSFGVGTHMGTASDTPYSDVVYKIAAVTDAQGRFLPTMKLSRSKMTYPGSKQVWRYCDKKGNFKRDLLTLEQEKIQGAKPLLIKVMEKGKLKYTFPSLSAIRQYCSDNLSRLPERYKRIDKPERYSLKISKSLKHLSTQVSRKILTRSASLGLPSVVFMDIDTQQDFMDKNGALPVPQAHKITGNLRRLTNFAQKRKMMIVASADKHRVGDPEFKLFPPHCVKGTREQRKIAATQYRPATTIACNKRYPDSVLRSRVRGKMAVILEKSQLSVFSNPNTKPLLRDVIQVYIYGVATEYCVREAVLGLRHLDIKTVVISDAIKAVSPSAGKKTVKELKDRGVMFMTTEGVLKELSKR